MLWHKWRRTLRIALGFGLFAFAWFASQGWSVLEALWEATTHVRFSNFQVASGAESQSSTYTISFPLVAGVCQTPTILFDWDDPSKSISEPEGKSITWTTPDSSVTFQVSSNCQVPLVLQATSSQPTFSFLMPWGVSRSEEGFVASTDTQHDILVFPGEETTVHWFAPSEAQFALQVSAQASSTTLYQGTSLPLLSQWFWLAQVGPTQLPHDSSVLTGCHFLAQVFFSLSEGSCVGQQLGMNVLYQKNPTVSHSDSQHALATSPQPGQVFISEINWAGSFSAHDNLANDEWIELINMSPEPINLLGLEIVGAAAGGSTITLQDSIVLPPYGLVILSRLEKSESLIQSASSYRVPHLSLSNTQAGLTLRLSDGTVLDVVPTGAWQVGKNTTTSPRKRASAQRKNFILDAVSTWDNWSDCVQEPSDWCTELARRSLHPDARDTLSSPGMYPPW